MPRSLRHTPGGVVYHVLNRAVARLAIFEAEADYTAFLRVFRQAVERQETLASAGKGGRIDVLGWCLMPNHWHLVLQPHGQDLSDFMRWLSMTHTQRWHAHRRSAGSGPLYQGRFKSFPVDEEGEHLPSVLAYVERNAKTAGLVQKARDWPWGSLGRRGRQKGEPPGGEVGPALLPFGQWPGRHAYDLLQWRREVERPRSEAEVSAIQASIRRGRPYGGEAWTKRIAGRLHLSHTLRSRGRPTKQQGDGKKGSRPL